MRMSEEGNRACRTCHDGNAFNVYGENLCMTLCLFVCVKRACAKETVAEDSE